ncbi:MAG: hypothetical protein ACHQF2_03125 [Flavobacteriales bacterium]
MASYRNIQQLLNELQAKVNKLQAGNLTYEELSRLKTSAAELHERIAIIEYKVNERLLKNPGAVVPAEESEKVNLFEEDEKNAGFRISTTSHDTVSEKKIAPVIEPVNETKKETPVKEIAQPVFADSPETPGTLAEKLKKTKIHDLKTAIPLNHKFLFMNTLFEGENESYNDALDKLNSLQGLEEARQYLRELSNQYGWDFEDEKVISFTEFIERRHM